MSLAAVLAGMQQQGREASLVVDEGWAQGRTLFGGIQAAVLMELLRRCVDGAQEQLKSVHVTFMNAVAPGELRLTCEPLREGRTAYYELRIWQNEKLCCQAVAMLGQHRDSALKLSHLEYPIDRLEGVVPLDQGQDFPNVPGLTPAFVQQFQMRLAYGRLPFSGAKTDETALYLKLRGEHGSRLSQLVALCDAAPTPLLSKLKGPAAASSAFWSLDIVNPEALNTLDGWTVLHNAITFSEGGYAVQNGSIWCAERKSLLAISQQTVMVFA